jgi:hypothetical protein
MSAVLTYTSLLDTVHQYCERPNDLKLVAQLPTFIALAENRIAADLKLLGTQQVVVGAFTLGDPVIEKPAYWRDTVSINFTNSLNEIVSLKLRTYEFCRAFWPIEATRAAPRYYAEYDYGHLIVAPTPDVAYAIELLYHARLEPLDATNEQNWLTFNVPQIMLYATMLEAQLWLKNVEKAALWQAQYEAAKESVLSENAKRKTDRTTVVTS